MNPYLAFAAIWAAVIALHSLTVMHFYETFSAFATALIVGIPIVAWAIGEAVVPKFRKLDGTEIEVLMLRAERFRDRVALLAAVIFAFEGIFFRGVPALWMIAGETRGYADFGIPTLHGVFNAFLMFVTSSSGIFAVLGHKKLRNFAIFLIGISIMALLFSRAMMVITLIQIGSIVLFRLRTHFTYGRAAALLVLTVAGLYFFGVLGNLRSAHQENAPLVAYEEDLVKTWAVPESAEPVIKTAAGILELIPWGYNPFIYMIAENREGIFHTIPTEFLWAYAYVTSGYNNLLFNLNAVTPTYTPATTFSKLLPTIVYAAVGMEKRVDAFVQAHPAFTVSTAFAGPVSDFGYLGLLLAIPLLIGASAAFRGALSGSVRSTLLYAMLFQSIILTPYVDTVLYTTFVLQMALAWLAGVDFKNWARRTAPESQ